MPFLTSSKILTRARARYRRLPLVELIELIAHHGDLAALRELHEHRTIFHHKRGPGLRLVEYLQRLRESSVAQRLCGHNANILDRAYDLTNDKFSRLPGNPASRGRRQAARGRQRGPDCRYYFRAFLEYVAQNAKTSRSALEAELFAARRLQTFVYRHFLFSCKDAARQEPGASRTFFWRVNGRGIRVWMPSDMSRVQCKGWLKANVEAPDFRRPGERKRVQGIIDQRLGRPAVLRFSQALGEKAGRMSKCQSIPWSVQHEMSTGGLAAAVAREKAQAIHRQRPAIRRLGPDQLARMIRCIFEELAAGTYKDSEVAHEFGLSKPTFSRFAGSRWSRRDTSATVIPDLWRNTAQVLAGNAVFTESAKAAGIWDQVIRSLQSPG